MNLSALNTRKEIICRLREILLLPSQAIDLNDTYKTCDFFLDDLAFDPPYTNMVGIVLYPDEATHFALFMEHLAATCRKRLELNSEGAGDYFGPLRSSSSDLLAIMLKNDTVE